MSNFDRLFIAFTCNLGMSGILLLNDLYALLLANSLLGAGIAVMAISNSNPSLD